LVGLGGAKSLQVPVDARALLGSLDRRKNLASDTFAELLADVGTLPPAAADPATGLAEPGGNLRLDPNIAKLSRGTGLSSSMLNPSTRAALAKALPVGCPRRQRAHAVRPHRRRRGRSGHRAEEGRRHRDPAHQDPEAARLQVSALLSASSGNPNAALKLLDQNVLGLDTTKASIQDSLSRVSLVHEVLGDLLTAQGPRRRRSCRCRGPAAAEPRDHSLVIIGAPGSPSSATPPRPASSSRKPMPTSS